MKRTMNKIFIIDKNRPSTITESSQYSTDSNRSYQTGSSRQESSISIGSDKGMPRQFTIGKYDSPTESETPSRKASQRKKRSLLKRTKKLACFEDDPLSVFGSKDSELITTDDGSDSSMAFKEQSVFSNVSTPTGSGTTNTSTENKRPSRQLPNIPGKIRL